MRPMNIHTSLPWTLVLLSLVTAIGLAGWAGIELTPPSSAAPTIIMTLAVNIFAQWLVKRLSLKY